MVEFYLKRISRINLNTILEINSDAFFIARYLDKERNEIKRSNLHGIPIVIKVNIDTCDNKMQTTASDKALKGNFTPEDAFLVKKLRKAGCAILGKTI